MHTVGSKNMAISFTALPRLESTILPSPKILCKKLFSPPCREHAARKVPTRSGDGWLAF